MASRIQSRHPAYRVYYVSTAVLGGATIAYSCYQALRMGADYRWLMLTALTVIAASFTIKIPGTGSKISIADTFVLVTMVFFGPAAGSLTGALEALAGSMRTSTSEKRWQFALFNTTNVALCAYFSGLLYFLALGREPLFRNPGTSLTGWFPAAVLLALAYYLSNSVTVAAIATLASGKNICRFWLDHFVWHSINYFACTFGAVLIAAHSSSISLSHLATAGLMVAIIYYAYRNILGKLVLTAGG